MVKEECRRSLQVAAMILVVLGSLSACRARCGEYACAAEDRRAAVDYVPLAAAPRPVSPRPPESVGVVVTPPQHPFVEVGLLEARQTDPCCSSRADVVQELRSAGARLGCDLVIIYGVTLKGYRSTCGVYYGIRDRGP